MNTQVKLFAAARDRVGSDTIHVAMQGTTIADLRTAIATAYPELETILKQAMFAVNTDYASDETVIQAYDEIACIPPVSGG